MGRKRVYRCPNCHSKLIDGEKGGDGEATHYYCTGCGGYAVF